MTAAPVSPPLTLAPIRAQEKPQGRKTMPALQLRRKPALMEGRHRGAASSHPNDFEGRAHTLEVPVTRDQGCFPGLGEGACRRAVNSRRSRVLNSETRNAKLENGSCESTVDSRQSTAKGNQVSVAMDHGQPTTSKPKSQIQNLKSPVPNPPVRANHWRADSSMP